jgi:ABC-2 type transport system ATP-binding protein
MNPMFRLTNVTKRFGKQLVLDNVSLEAPPGVVIALLGENGAGKTTSIRILLGLLEADAGESEVLGLDSRQQGIEIRRRVGYVPDRPVLYGWMTVDEVGWFAAGFHGPRYHETYRRLVGQFSLPLDKKVKTLSKGMLAKVSLAVAMAHEPELLILDEPTSGLDPVVRREFLSSMVDVAAEGRTVLLSSHQIHEVERVADIVAILRGGKLIAVERLDELKREVREVTVVLNEGVAEPSLAPGTIISKQRSGPQWRALVRGVRDDDLLRLRASDAVIRIDVRTPSLEEIFVGYLHPDRVPGASGTWERDQDPTEAPAEVAP